MTRALHLVRDDPSPAARDCFCRVTVLRLLWGEIALVHVSGEVDLVSIPALQGALTRALVRRPDHLIVDLGGTTFCGARALALLVRSGEVAAELDVGYSVCAVPRHLDRIWALVCPPRQEPAHHSTLTTGVIARCADARD